MNAAAFALAALLPTMIGSPGGAVRPGTMTVSLCGGGSLAIPLPNKKQSLPTGPKGCHAGCARKRFDPPQ